MNYKANIHIKLRDGILDVQGKTVEHALHSIEFLNITNVQIGKFVELNIEANSKEEALKVADSACAQLIANPIMESYSINLIGGSQ